MKTMTCRELGGACDEAFHANTFEEMADLSRWHGMKMHEAGDPAHLEAMQDMQALMKAPDEMQKWFESRRQAFEDLPDD